MKVLYYTKYSTIWKILKQVFYGSYAEISGYNSLSCQPDKLDPFYKERFVK